MSSLTEGMTNIGFLTASTDIEDNPPIFFSNVIISYGDVTMIPLVAVVMV